MVDSKKIGFLFLLLFLGIAISTVVIAENTTDINSTDTNTTESNQTENNTTTTEINQTENQTEGTEENETEELTEEDEEEIADISNSNFGAEVRLLQLEKHIMRNVLVGTTVVEYLQDKNSSLNLTKLEAILDQLEDLLEEVRETPREGNKTELAQTYVDLKYEAILLTKEFREEVRDLLGTDDRKDIRDAIRESESEQLEEINGLVLQASREFNANLAQRLLAGMNISNSSLIEQIRSGEATMAEVRAEIRNAFGELNNSVKKQVLTKTRERIIQQNIAKNMIKNEIKENFENNRNQARNLLNEEIKEKIKNQVNGNIKNMTQRIQKIQLNQSTLQKVQERLANMSSAFIAGRGR